MMTVHLKLHVPLFRFFTMFLVTVIGLTMGHVTTMTLVTTLTMRRCLMQCLLMLRRPKFLLDICRYSMCSLSRRCVLCEHHLSLCSDFVYLFTQFLLLMLTQIDSWWYFKGPDDGVKNWTAMPSVFPNGIEAVVKKTGWPIEAHNRWWYVCCCATLSNTCVKF